MNFSAYNNDPSEGYYVENLIIDDDNHMHVVSINNADKNVYMGLIGIFDGSVFTSPIWINNTMPLP